MTPAGLAAAVEAAPTLPAGTGDRFAGYGVMGLPFASGHVLAMRRFPAASVGPAYTSVWHRDPSGTWTFWQDQPFGCATYFGPSAELGPVDVSWPASHTLRVRVAAAGLDWTTTVRSTPVTAVLSAVAGALPDRLWASPGFLSVLGPVAGAALRAGRVGLAGTSPNGQRFVANPLRMWVVDTAAATVGDHDLGPVAPLASPAALGDFRIPQRGIIAFGRASFDT